MTFKFPTESVAGERQHIWHHYLKGSLWCGACHEAGREHRMILQRARGNGGIYFYFFCRGRQEGVCDEPFLPIAVVEDAVVRHYDHVEFEQDFVDEFRSQVVDIMDDDQRTTTLLRRQFRAQLDKLEVQESNLIDLAELSGLIARPRASECRNDRGQKQQTGQVTRWVSWPVV